VALVVLSLVLAVAVLATGTVVVTAGAPAGLGRGPRTASIPVDDDTVVALPARVVPAARLFSLMGPLDESTYGTVTVTVNDLHWVPAAGEGWVVPLRAVRVAGAGVAGVDFDIIGFGRWRLVVSGERVDRSSRTTARTFRQARVARTFADLLLARGARTAVA
jgi:hypothetical protein